MDNPNNPYRENAPPPPKREAKLGDVVQFKSGGGPKMTVCSINGDKAVCRYFKTSGGIDHFLLEVCALRVIEE